MPLYQYSIKTTHGKAFGTIEATDKDEAQLELSKMYAPEDHNLVTKKGTPVAKLELSEVILEEL